MAAAAPDLFDFAAAPPAPPADPAHPAWPARTARLFEPEARLLRRVRQGEDIAPRAARALAMWGLVDSAAAITGRGAGLLRFWDALVATGERS